MSVSKNELAGTVSGNQTAALISPEASAQLVGSNRDTLEKQFHQQVTSLTPSRLQLATAITQRHYTFNATQDLQVSIAQSLSQDWQRAHVAFALNTQDGPWAVAMSHNSLAWATVAANDLGTLKIVGNFLALVYLHLR